MGGITAGQVIINNISNKNSNENCTSTESGLTYKNCILDFQINRPNLDWSFDKNVTAYAQKTGISNIDSNLFGGVVVESPDRTVVEMPPSPDQYVIVLVFRGNATGFSDLSNVAQEQKQHLISNFPNASFTIQSSVDGNSVLVLAKDVPSTPRIYLHEKLERYGDKVYLFAWLLDSEQPVSPQTFADLNTTFSSFGHVL